MLKISNLTKTYQVERTDGKMERMTNLRVAFCNFANVPKNCQVSLPDPVAETARGPLYMPLFVNSD